MIHEFGWKEDDWDLLAKGIVLGHLFECAGQVTGGYFADPPYKVVPELHRLGFPIAEICADGQTVITKTPNSGGVVSPATCAEQMLYETDDLCQLYSKQTSLQIFRILDLSRWGWTGWRSRGRSEASQSPRC